MLTKLAGFVLAGSVVALAGLGVADLAGVELRDPFNGHSRHERRIERRIRHEMGPRDHGESHRGRRVHVERYEANDVASVLGKYEFEAKGDVLGKVPWAARVTLDLQPDGRYELRVATSADGEMDEETSWGRYRVVKNRLVLISGGDHDSHMLLIDGDRLRFDESWKARLAMKAVGVDEGYLTKMSGEAHRE
jgi:hypothetical protein